MRKLLQLGLLLLCLAGSLAEESDSDGFMELAQSESEATEVELVETAAEAQAEATRPVASSCMDALLRGLASKNGQRGTGTYVIDDGNTVRDMYCDMQTDGGGWTLVANIADNGGMFPANPDLQSSFSYGTYSPTWDHSTHYYAQFSNIPHSEMMFKTGNSKVWCVVDYNQLNPLYKPGVFSPNLDIVSAKGTFAPRGSKGNILSRPNYVEDPWIGCAGNHWNNIHQMLWGENGYRWGAHPNFKNANGGVGVFVRFPAVTGALKWGGHQYFKNRRPGTWSESERLANKYAGHLVSITSRREEDFIFSNFLTRPSDTYWIGLARSWNGGPFQHWVTGEPYGFSAWNPGEPNNAGGWEQCTHIISNNRWNDLPCWANLYGLTEVSRDNVFKGKLYMTTTTPLTYVEAETAAIAMGGHLAAINSAAENEYLSNNFAKRLNQHFWIGLKRPWQGAPFQKWSTGEVLDYSAWHPGEPNNWGGNEACTTLLSWTPKWNDINCGAKFFGIIEVPIERSNPAMVLNWRLGGAVNDNSGNGVGAFLAGGVKWKKAPRGPRTFLSRTMSLYFNGLQTPQVYNPNKNIPRLQGEVPFSFAVWAYFDSSKFPADWIGVFGVSSDSSKGPYNNGVGLALYQGRLVFQMYGSEVRSDGNVVPHKWYHLIATKTPGPIFESTTLYINGDMQTHTLAGENIAVPVVAGAPLLGRAGDFNIKQPVQRYFTGFLKDARVFNYALTRAEAKNLYNEDW